MSKHIIINPLNNESNRIIIWFLSCQFILTHLTPSLITLLMLSTSESSIDIQGSCFFVAKFLALSHTQKLIEIGCRYSELGIQPKYLKP